MGDSARRLTGLAVVTTAALAAVLATGAGPAERASAPPGFGRVDTVLAAAPEASGPPAPLPAASPAEPSPAPRRVTVPRVGLDAPVRPVGVTAEGDMAVPADPAVAGWYHYGPAPGGAEGSAVLVGHVDGETGDLGEFAALYRVRPGDRVQVGRAGAEPVAYRVTARTTVPKDALPDEAFRRSGPPVLTLITCAPPFTPEDGGYQANLIVVAEPLTS
ncbi:class F sortase [Streptomyces fradiae]|uniref:class F sortase n=1 Tax=Streptomyces TaxID=1883 RepID=UPI002019F44D|nr:class F sortase [Streptomyces fradiae]UQS29853.1 class F sortase [Streptomyces fradiae]